MGTRGRRAERTRFAAKSRRDPVVGATSRWEWPERAIPRSGERRDPEHPGHRRAQDIATPHHRRAGTNQIDVVLEASPSGFQAQQIPVRGEIKPCWNDGPIEAVGTFDIVLDITAGPEEAPPSVEIDIPASVTCNASTAGAGADVDGEHPREQVSPATPVHAWGVEVERRRGQERPAVEVEQAQLRGSADGVRGRGSDA
jgi:hypothetical protein